MWDKASRMKVLSPLDYKNCLGPTTYNPYPNPKIKACRVPFNRTAHAQALANNVPSPCTYNIRYRKHRIKGGVSLWFKEARTTFVPKLGPSPITYDPDLLYVRETTHKTKGKVYRGKPPRYGSVPAISIPYKFFDGFDIIKGKGLVLRPLRIDFCKRAESTYQPFPYEVCKATLKYKGNHWSRLKSERKFVYSGHPNSPGVGFYNLLDKKATSFDNYLVTVRFNKTSTAPSLRWNDRYIKKVILQNYPAPSTYNIKYDEVYKKKYFSSFGTLSKFERFKYPEKTDMSNLNIGPILKTSIQRCWPPFNSSSLARPKKNKSGIYDIISKSSIEFSPKKNKFKAPFDSSGKRETGCSLNNNPGPGTYDLLEKPRRIIYGTCDRNNCIPPVRLTPLRDFEQHEVSPCTYDVKKVMRRVYDKKDFHKGQIWALQKKAKQIKAIKPDIPDALNFIEKARRIPLGNIIFRERPKRKIIEITPGPANYNVHPLYTFSCIKAYTTHNVTSDLKLKVCYEKKIQKCEEYVIKEEEYKCDKHRIET